MKNTNKIQKSLTNWLIWWIWLTIWIVWVYAYTTWLGWKVATDPLKSSDWNSLVANVDEVNGKLTNVTNLWWKIWIWTTNPSRNLQLYSDGITWLSISTLWDNLSELNRIDFINNGSDTLWSSWSIWWIIYSRWNNFWYWENNNFWISSFNWSVRNTTITSNLNWNVWIWNLNTSYKFRVNWTAWWTSAYANASDIRYKKNIETITWSINKIQNLRWVYFDWKIDEYKNKDFEKSKQVWFIAQEVEKVLPEVVNTDIDWYKSVKYASINALLVEWFKEQQQQIEELKNEIEILKSRN